MTARPWLKITYDPFASGYCWQTNWPRRGKHRIPGKWIVFDRAAKDTFRTPIGHEMTATLFAADTPEECSAWITAQQAPH